MKYIKLFESKEELPTIEYLESLFINFIESDKLDVKYNSEKNIKGGEYITDWSITITIEEDGDNYCSGTKEILDYLDNIKELSLDITNLVETIINEYSEKIVSFYYIPERHQFEVYCRCESEEEPF